MKDIPVLFDRKEDCCGCTACYAICPKGAITMKGSAQGTPLPEKLSADQAGAGGHWCQTPMWSK